MAKELDREQQEIMQINIIATADRNGPPREPKKKAILNITIIVLDENDNNPIFETNFYSAGVALEDPPDKLIMTVKVSYPFYIIYKSFEELKFLRKQEIKIIK